MMVFHSGVGVLSGLLGTYKANTLRPASRAHIALLWAGGRHGTNMAHRRSNAAAVRNNRTEGDFFLIFDTSAPPGGSFWIYYRYYFFRGSNTISLLSSQTARKLIVYMQKDRKQACTTLARGVRDKIIVVLGPS